MHASQPADASAPLLEDEECGGRPRLSRACCMICMVPAQPHIVDQPDLPRRRQELVDDACTTTHWPQENKVASQGVRGSGVRGFRYLPPEAKALCRGEPCSRRARAWREEASGWGSEYGQSAAGPADQALC